MGQNLHALIPDRPGSQYSREQVQEAAAHYVVTGSVAKVQELTGYPRQTIVDWSRTDWWDSLTVAIRAEKSDELDGALSGLIHAATAAAADRIEHGDHVIDRDGQLRRVPVKARDAMLVAAVAFDKRQISRNLPTSISESGSDRLRALQEQLRAISGRTIEGSSVRVEGGGDE